MNRKNVHLPDSTLEQIGASDTLSARIVAITDRYAEICARELPLARFTPSEQAAIFDACLSWLAQPAAAIFGGIALEVEDALADGLASKWDIDGPTLLDKINALRPAEQVALVDWIERA